MQFCYSTKLLLATVIRLSTFLVSLLILPAVGLAQAGLLEADISLLKRVMPDAVSFSEKAGDPPVYRAFGAAEQDGEGELIGYLFETPDYPPEEVGYAAPIEVLVGMDLQGVLSGIEILYYRESYKSIRGDFLNTERFPNQFKGMSVSDGFRVGRDLDGVSRATISSWATSRGIRNAARRVARNYLRDSEFVANANSGEAALKILQAQSWEEMKESGLVKEFPIVLEDLTELHLTLVFMGNEALGELLVGPDDYSRAEREASNRVQDGSMLLVGIAGNASTPFRQERLAITQGDAVYNVERRRFVYVGSADAGMIANKVRFAGAIVLSSDIDLSQPFTVLYDTGVQVEAIEELAQIDYQVPPVSFALATGAPLPAEFLPKLASPFPDFDDFEEVDEGVVATLINSAPLTEVLALLFLFAMVMTAFLRKSSTIRWATLAYTLFYLGFYNGTFLSVSHLTNGLKQGPALFLSDLPLLLIVVFTIVTTLFWGRVFCSSLCPFGALQDFITRIMPKKWQIAVPQAIHDKALYIKYAILALLVVTSLTFSDLSLFQYFEPFGTLFYISRSMVLWAILAAFLLASMFISRFYCRYACPLGAALGVTSFLSPFRINRVQQCEVCKVCEKNCPTGAIRGAEIDFKECVRCDICESKLIAKAGVCKHTVEDVMARHKTWTPVTVT
ncbi:MAG: 4Fe-4S binding protein [Gammaproteobacteria bacterium]|nr:4Fe-4S binding protein [Gammaproteobacteria bacterium]